MPMASQEYYPQRHHTIKNKPAQGIKALRQASMGDEMMHKMTFNNEKSHCNHNHNHCHYINESQYSPQSAGSTEASSDDEKCYSNSDFESESVNCLSRKMSKQESGWKRKVKTELCKFWLNGLECENQHKEQGCGFAHGQEELQKKKGLSKQYMTSVCKNFLEHPSKCTYG